MIWYIVFSPCISVALLPSEILEFRWNTNDHERLFMDPSLGKQNEDVFYEAYQNCQPSFHESYDRFAQHLKQFGIKVDKPLRNTMMIDSGALSDAYIVRLLNSCDNQKISMYSKSEPDKFIHVKGKLFLYGFCKIVRCKVFLFSTRSKPIFINPSRGNLNPVLYLLEHTDSYLQKTTYFSLSAGKGKHPRKSIFRVSNEDQLVATKRGRMEKKPRSDYTKIGRTLHEEIISCVTDTVNSFYQKSWKRFKAKEEQKSKSFNDLVEAFKKSIPKKSFPDGVVNEVKAKIEVDITNKTIQAEIPKSSTWLHNKVSRLKKENKIPAIQVFIENFIKTIGEERSDPDTQDESEDQVDIDLIFDGNEQSIETISKTLKGCINPKFSYNALLTKMEKLQQDCGGAIFGLSKALGILVKLIVTGKAFGAGYVDANNDFSMFDFSNDGISTDGVFLTENAKKILEKEDFFTRDGFAKILSFCVGRKKVEKKKFP